MSTEALREDLIAHCDFDDKILVCCHRPKEKNNLQRFQLSTRILVMPHNNIAPQLQKKRTFPYKAPPFRIHKGRKSKIDAILHPCNSHTDATLSTASLLNVLLAGHLVLTMEVTGCAVMLGKPIAELRELLSETDARLQIHVCLGNELWKRDCHILV